MTTCEWQSPGHVTLRNLVESIADTHQEKHPRGGVAGEKRAKATAGKGNVISEVMDLSKLSTVKLIEPCKCLANA